MNLRLDISHTIQLLSEMVDRPIQLMEVCGTHTVAISRSGLRHQLPKNIRLLSGPGCPVCVTPVSIIDLCIELSHKENVDVFSFGDMLRVPGSNTSLQTAKLSGGKIHVVYSPLEALDYAKQHPNQEVIFIGVGFETTLPIIAATIVRAKSEHIVNFSVIPAGKLAPPAMAFLMEDPNVCIDGFICPGHVSSIIGSKPYEFLVERFKVPCVITGFTAQDVADGILMLVRQIQNNQPQVEIQYKRAVQEAGNPTAIDIQSQVFECIDAEWRGIGTIPQSGVSIRHEYENFDALIKFNLKIKANDFVPTGCQCGNVMQGRIVPNECPLFGNKCTPNEPIGACMVSSEGACAAYYRYEQNLSNYAH